MTPSISPTWTAFADLSRLASGQPREVTAVVKERADAAPSVALLVFDDATGRPVELDLRGTVEAAVARVGTNEPTESTVEEAGAPVSTRGPGRPRLGVVAREVTLLPRHWEWLAGQPGGASVALRKLVEQARRDREQTDRQRTAREVAYRVMSALAGNLPGFEEASRALFAGDGTRFAEQTEGWPPDVAGYVRELAAPGLGVAA